MAAPAAPSSAAPDAPLAVTMGEPAGVGGELLLKAWHGGRQAENPFFALDDPGRLADAASALGLTVPLREIAAPAEAAAVFMDALPVLPVALVAPATPGRPDPANARAVTQAIERAVELTASGAAAAVVTNPIQKATLYDAGFEYPGHTEFLAALAGISTPPVMMLACEALRTVPVTVHVSLRRAIDELTTDAIVTKARITALALRTDFAIFAPRLAVAGLNPHGGEGGALGTEDRDVIAPAVAALRAEGIEAWGPVPPDTLFSPKSRQTYDAAICMYHDQALIPVKALDFEGGVNVTLGLPFVRTSPDHGTALDIAGTGKADEHSLLAAMAMARNIARNRARAERA